MTKTSDTPQVPADRAPLPPHTAGPVGRFPIFDVWPVVDFGRRPAKAAENERIRVRCTATREGHDSLGVSVVLTDPSGNETVHRAELETNDRYSADIRPTSMGHWTFRVEAWDDPWGTWHHAAGLKVPAGVDVELELLEGALLLELALSTTQATASVEVKTAISTAIAALRDVTGAPEVRLALAFDPIIDHAMHSNPVRSLVTRTQEFPLYVERHREIGRAHV